MLSRKIILVFYGNASKKSRGDALVAGRMRREKRGLWFRLAVQKDSGEVTVEKIAD